MEAPLPQYTTTLDAQGVPENGALERLGGKGKSLTAMASAGFNVPAGFLVTTSAYRSFVSDNALQPRIIELAKPALVENRVSFDEASDNVHALFAAGELAGSIVKEVTSAYRALGDAVPVAVRSSANAEDLPDLSFAGQQETYLNVRGEDEVVAAMRACWASLWTARAINYRHQNGIDQNGVAMAVVVQVMVPSSVLGNTVHRKPGDRGTCRNGRQRQLRSWRSRRQRRSDSRHLPCRPHNRKTQGNHHRPEGTEDRFSREPRYQDGTCPAERNEISRPLPTTW